jgi:enoyl-CoA hydratase
MNTEFNILFEKRGEAGIITLNRPKSLNALNLSMVRALHAQLNIWKIDPSITRVILMGAGDKAFCAGGDIRALYELGKQNRFNEALQFWREEYQLNRALKYFPKPFISIIDGIVMGGGFGLSAHGSHRVAGGKYQFSMPEVSIGFFPDVGATYVLPRLSSYIGHYLALTGECIGSADALAVGLATHAIQSTYLEKIIGELAAGDNINRILRKYSAVYQQPNLDDNRAIIHCTFSEPNILNTLARLDQYAANGSAFAGKTASIIRSKSPSSLAVVHKQMHYGQELEFDAAMVLEYRIVSRIGCSLDFFEGVRAAIIDKDRKPLWTPACLEDISQAETNSYFAPLTHNELIFE